MRSSPGVTGRGWSTKTSPPEVAANAMRACWPWASSVSIAPCRVWTLARPASTAARRRPTAPAGAGPKVVLPGRPVRASARATHAASATAAAREGRSQRRSAAWRRPADSCEAPASAASRRCQNWSRCPGASRTRSFSPRSLLRVVFIGPPPLVPACRAPPAARRGRGVDARRSCRGARRERQPRSRSRSPRGRPA